MCPEPPAKLSPKLPDKVSPEPPAKKRKKDKRKKDKRPFKLTTSSVIITDNEPSTLADRVKDRDRRRELEPIPTLVEEQIAKERVKKRGKDLSAVRSLSRGKGLTGVGFHSKRFPSPRRSPSKSPQLHRSPSRSRSTSPQKTRLPRTQSPAKEPYSRRSTSAQSSPIRQEHDGPQMTEDEETIVDSDVQDYPRSEVRANPLPNAEQGAVGSQGTGADVQENVPLPTGNEALEEEPIPADVGHHIPDVPNNGALEWSFIPGEYNPAITSWASDLPIGAPLDTPLLDGSRGQYLDPNDPQSRNWRDVFPYARRRRQASGRPPNKARKTPPLGWELTPNEIWVPNRGICRYRGAAVAVTAKKYTSYDVVHYSGIYQGMCTRRQQCGRYQKGKTDKAEMEQEIERLQEVEKSLKEALACSRQETQIAHAHVEGMANQVYVLYEALRNLGPRTPPAAREEYVLVPMQGQGPGPETRPSMPGPSNATGKAE